MLWRTCESQRTTFGSQVSLLCVLGVELRSPGLCANHCYLLSHLTGLGLGFEAMRDTGCSIAVGYFRSWMSGPEQGHVGLH